MVAFARKKLTIANGATQSSSYVDIEDYTVFALEMPAAFTGTTITFQGAGTPNDTFLDIYDESGTQISITVAASRIIGLDAAALEIAAIPFLKITSGSAEGASRDVFLLMKR